MSFSRQILAQVREQAVQQVIEANAQIADIDKTLALLDGAAAAPAPLPHFNHVHEAGELRVVGHVEVGTVHVTQQGSAEPVVTPEQFEAALDELSPELKELFPPAPVPESDELTFSAPPAPEAKTGGRRTNEEIAAEIGVNLEDVKEWKGGGRVSRADMEEFKKLHAGAAIPGQQTIDDVGAPEPDVEAAPDMWSESDTSGGEADTANESAKPQRVEQTPPSYGTADEAFVADDAETFEPPF